PGKERPEPARAVRPAARRREEIGMDRPSSLAFRSRPSRSNNFRFGSRAFLRIALLAFGLAFAHVWESVTLAELRTRMDRELARREQQELRLRQLTSQLAQWGARAEETAGASSRLGFSIPADGQVVLLSAGLAGTGRTQLAASPPH